MSRFRSTFVLMLCTALATAACEAAKSANPTSPDVAGPIPGVSITAPTPLEPQQGAQVTYTGEPVTLLTENASTTGQRALYMQIEVAADAGFQQVVHHADRLDPGPNGRTSYRMPEPLGAGHTYHWRARALDGANAGPYSFVSTFAVVNPVIIETPTPIEPSGNLSTNRPQFRVRNGRIEGTSEAYYRFELATAPDPAATVAVMTVTPGSDGETVVSAGDLPYDRTFYWRVYGTDGTTRSLYSPVISFRTAAAPAGPAPGPGPSPGPPPSGPLPPGGSGGRTPDPPPGVLLPLPAYGAAVVVDVARQYPGDLANACGSRTWLFRVLHALRQRDSRFGLNYKRGHRGDLSSDIITYNPTNRPDNGEAQVYLVDVIGSICEGNNPTWTDVTPTTWAAGGSAACGTAYCAMWTIDPYLGAGFPR